MADDKGRQELTTDDGKGCKIFLYKTNSEAAQTVTYILEVAKFASLIHNHHSQEYRDWPSTKQVPTPRNITVFAII